MNQPKESTEGHFDASVYTFKHIREVEAYMESQSIFYSLQDTW